MCNSQKNHHVLAPTHVKRKKNLITGRSDATSGNQNRCDRTGQFDTIQFLIKDIIATCTGGSLAQYVEAVRRISNVVMVRLVSLLARHVPPAGPIMASSGNNANNMAFADCMGF